MARLRYHQCKNLREFNKIFRKYTKYTLPLPYKYRMLKRRGGVWHKMTRQQHWYCWLSVEFVGLDALNSKELIRASQKKITYYSHRDKRWITTDDNLLHIRKEAVEHNGEVFKGKRDEKLWRFIGIEITNEDYYYIYENVDDPKERQYNTCVGAYNEIGELV